MDMQYNLLANDPMFFGLGGLMEWTSGYADEENLRWAARLYRHYAIEGRTEMLSPKYGFQFRLAHIQNPDFDAGLRGWEVKAAEAGSVDARTFGGYSSLQGRYPETSQGNTFLWMKRSGKAPNTVSQTIKDLVPGKLYSVKMLSSDYGDLLAKKSDAKTTGPNILITNVELLPAKFVEGLSAARWFQNVSGFDGKNPYWVTFHSRVFRAKAAEARLTLSDWAGEKDPGGPEGQETVCNFLEVQPYLED
jgi:hypothetical protein